MSEKEIRALIKEEVEKARVELLQGMVALAEQLERTIKTVNDIVSVWNRKS